MKTKELAIPVSVEVAAFAVCMEAKLRMEGFDDFEAWNRIPPERLMQQLERKIQALKKNPNPSAEEIFTKSIIIGNIAMMLSEYAARMRADVIVDRDRPTQKDPNRGLEATAP